MMDASGHDLDRHPFGRLEGRASVGSHVAATAPDTIEAVHRSAPLCLLLLAGCIEEHPNWAADTGDADTQADSSSETNSGASESGEETGASDDTSGGDGDGDTGWSGDGDGDTTATGDGDGGTSTTTSGAGDPDCDSAPHTIFITSGNWTGTFGSLTQADTHCQDFANQASLGGSWKAVISDSTGNAVDRLSFSGAICNRMGDLVAADGSELWNGAIETGVIYSEWGGVITNHAWTGTSGSGLHAPGESCDDWTAASPTSVGVIGDPVETNLGWVEVGTDSCQNASRALYCVSQ
jgi:hypothetical protein